MNIGIVNWPSEHPLPPKTKCIICREEVELSKLTMGLYDVAGQPAFACNDHRINRTMWTFAWLNFAYEQTRQQQLTQSDRALGV